MDSSSVPFPTHPTSNVTLLTYQSLTSLPFLPSFTNNSPSTDSDGDSTNTVFHTISQFKFSDVESPEEFQNSETRPSTLSQPPFRPLHTPTPDEPSSTPFSYTDATPILFPMASDQIDPPSSVNEKLEIDLDNFITVQQQLQNPHTFTIHHLSQSIFSSESSNPASTTEESQANRVFKRKHPNAQMHHQLDCVPFQPLHINSKKNFLQICLPFFLQYTHFQTTDNDQRNYVDEYSLVPTISWKLYYHFTNPLTLPLHNNPEDNVKCQARSHHLTTALYENHSQP